MGSAKGIRSAAQRRKRLRLACALAMLWPLAATANPMGPQVISGQATFLNNGNALTVTNTPGTIINWNGFSINAGELTRFIQESASSAVLNRVVGADPSRILGTLLSNGQVFLINPNGIVFGAGATVDTAGLVASTLDLSNKDFAAGKLNFAANQQAGTIDNAAVIRTPQGGFVYLVAPDVENSGLITSPQGQIILAAGHSVDLVSPESPALRVVVSSPGGKATNMGKIIAQSGQIGIYAGLIDQSGIVDANTVVQGKNGQITLEALGNINMAPGSLTTASGVGESANDGGSIQIDAAGGTLDLASGATVAVNGGGEGGNGGAMDLSGQGLILQGVYSGQAFAPGYREGSLLLDPYFINITAGNTASDTPLTSGNIYANQYDGQTLYISPTELASAAFSNISLQAVYGIVINSPIASIGKAQSLDLQIPGLIGSINVEPNAAIGTANNPLPANITMTAASINLRSSLYATGNVVLGGGAVNLYSNNTIPLTISANQFSATNINIGPGLFVISSASGGVITNLAFPTGNLTFNGQITVANFTSPPGYTEKAGTVTNNGKLSFTGMNNIGEEFINNGSVDNFGQLTFAGPVTINTTRFLPDAFLNEYSSSYMSFKNGFSNISPIQLVGGLMAFGTSGQYTLSAQNVTAQPGGSVTVAFSGQNGPLAFNKVLQSPNNGTFVNNGNGTYTYTANPAFNGDYFTYMVYANAGGTAVVTQQIQPAAGTAPSTVPPAVPTGTAIPAIPSNVSSIITQVDPNSNSSKINSSKGGHNVTYVCQ
ncbi:filamentous hemagglutinin N-terminal domain-containing protein [Acidithiobacillus sulfuriphilus]